MDRRVVLIMVKQGMLGSTKNIKATYWIAYFDGQYYLLEIPYSDDRELILDIMKYGPDVEIIRPNSLRNKALNLFLQAARQYTK